MKIIPNLIRTSRSSRARTGFTLTELLVVIIIIVLLVSILLPSLISARLQMLRTSCLHNTRELARGCTAYANDGTVNRGYDATNLPCIPNCLPSTIPSNGSAWGGNTGNVAAFWLLLKREFISIDNLLCAEAELRLGHVLLSSTDLQQVYPPSPFVDSGTSSNISYGYLSQVPFTDTTVTPNVAYHGVSLVDSPSYLVIVADRNPRLKNSFGGGSPDSAQNDLNSFNHKQDGQNFARLDGSANWQDNPRVFVKVDPAGNQIYNNIYCADTVNTRQTTTAIDGGADSAGRRSYLDDFYILP